MNEECTVFQNQNEDASTSCDSVAQAPAPCTDASTEEGEKAPLRESNEASAGVFADPCTDSDTDSQNTDSAPQKSELDELRSELMQLRQALEESRTRLSQMEHIEHQYAEFCELYPDVAISSLPREVWQNVGNGTSLAAAFALAEHRYALSLKKASDSNSHNRARSAGAVNSAENVEFSPAEVRAMTSSEVRANLSKIMRSMQKWH